MKRRPTIIDVAAEAGVSTATVSRVLNGGPVTDRTRLAVEQAIRTLGYRRNTLARSLVTGRSEVVGVLIPETVGPLYGDIARGIEEELGHHGMHVMVVSDHRDPEQERSAIELLLERQVDALVVVASHLDDATLRALAAGLPLSLVQREVAGNAFSTVEIDNAHGIRLAVAHLLEHGHRCIAFVGGLRRDGVERRAAFEAAMHEAGLTPAAMLDGDFSEAGGYQAGLALAELNERGRVSAVICANDRSALGLYHALKSRGRRLPQDLSVVGFDDLPWGAYLDPPLTTIRQPGREIGRQAALQVLGATSAPARHLVTPKLIRRGSVAPAAEPHFSARR